MLLIECVTPFYRDDPPSEWKPNHVTVLRVILVGITSGVTRTGRVVGHAADDTMSGVAVFINTHGYPVSATNSVYTGWQFVKLEEGLCWARHARENCAPTTLV